MNARIIYHYKPSILYLIWAIQTFLKALGNTSPLVLLEIDLVFKQSSHKIYLEHGFHYLHLPFCPINGI